MGFILAGILGLALLMVVHESGHLLAARAFGMRVIRFSIGFGPALWRYQAKGSETVYQVALIPFLAYVQIAGMNPFEEVDEEDKGSYANASLFARISAIFAGPLANYLFASVLFFAALMIGGQMMPTTTVEVIEPPAKSVLKNGDTVLGINGTKITDWEQMRNIILANPNKAIEMEVQRGKDKLKLQITPALKEGGGRIGVQPVSKAAPIAFKDALVQSVVLPVRVVKGLVVGLGKIITGQERPDFKGPVGIAKEASKAAKNGAAEFLWLLGVLSAYLGGFNLLPFPALDGGRLAFLSYEAVTRRKPNARIEANIHALGLLMLLTLIAVVSFFDFKSN
jgi:regulator of sigma E protease